jgi:tetratricopeptide (TPR) repeat protein
VRLGGHALLVRIASHQNAVRVYLTMRIAPILALLVLSGMAFALPAQVDDLATARAAFRGGDLTAAAAAVDRYLVARPADERARFLQGVILSEQGRTNEAFDVFFALTLDHPELAEPYNNIAVIYAARGEYERAREALESAIRANPDYAVAYENLGDVYARLAARAYEKSLGLDAGNRTVRAKLALARELPVATPKRPAADPPGSPADPPR